MNWIELFAGGGGVATGLKAARHHVSVAIEKEPDIARVYQDNHPDTPLITADIRDVMISSLPADITALWASPVCKQDSKARLKTLAPRADATIGEAILPYLKAIQPELVIIENVEQYKYNPSFALIVGYLSRHYAMSMRVLDAANYGVPQHRERLILQARRGPIAWPNFAPRRISWYTALQDRFNLMEEAGLANWQKKLWKVEYQAMLPIMIHGHYDNHNGREDRQLDVLKASEPSRTVTSSHNNTQRRILLKDGRILRLSPQENGRLQTFPDTYIFPKQMTLAQQIIGNAVPCLLVQRLTENYVAPQIEDDATEAAS